jgi:hypothetical protein
MLAMHPLVSVKLEGNAVAQIRTQLYSSTFWSARRPKFPLTEGHLVLRLNDPAIAFGEDSAADLLHCYGRLRRALASLRGATAAQLYMSLNWQPVGDSLGEPLAETSTPTLHVFFHWPGSTTPATTLGVPAHQRVAAEGTGELDGALRSWLDGARTSSGMSEDLPAADLPVTSAAPRPGDPAPGEDRTWEPPGWEDRPFHIEPARPGPGEPFHGGHWTAVPRFPAATLDRLDPAALVELAGTLAKMVSQSRPKFQGSTVWATDPWDAPIPAVLHLFGRQHGESPRMLPDFLASGGLDLPSPMNPHAKSSVPSPSVET